MYNEIINGRLAMLGFIGAIAGEFASTDDIIEEFELDPRTNQGRNRIESAAFEDIRK